MSALGNYTARLNGLIIAADNLFDSFTPKNLRKLESCVSSAFIAMHGNMNLEDRKLYSALQGKIKTLQAQENLMRPPTGELAPPAAAAAAAAPRANRDDARLSFEEQMRLALQLSQIEGQSRPIGGGAAAVESKAPEQDAPQIFRARLVYARQYDRESDKPPACSLHSLYAINEISKDFDKFFNRISHNDPTLSLFQINLILKGEEIYREKYGKRVNPSDIKPYIQETLGYPLDIPNNYTEMQSLNDRLTFILDDLFQAKQRVGCFITPNYETFAVIKNENRAIIFDSHKNIIIATSSREALENVLREKLGQHLEIVAGLGSNHNQYWIGDPSCANDGCILM